MLGGFGGGFAWYRQRSLVLECSVGQPCQFGGADSEEAWSLSIFLHSGCVSGCRASGRVVCTYLGRYSRVVLRTVLEVPGYSLLWSPRAEVESSGERKRRVLFVWCGVDSGQRTSLTEDSGGGAWVS